MWIQPYSYSFVTLIWNSFHTTKTPSINTTYRRDAACRRVGMTSCSYYTPAKDLQFKPTQLLALHNLEIRIGIPNSKVIPEKILWGSPAPPGLSCSDQRSTHKLARGGRSNQSVLANVGAIQSLLFCYCCCPSLLGWSSISFRGHAGELAAQSVELVQHVPSLLVYMLTQHSISH